jgi:spermidine/putrescine transport system substrate-binding protein
MPRDLPADPLIRSLVEHAQRARMTRRGLLGLAGAGAVSLALAACSRGAGPKAAADVSSSDKTVTWANWPLYMDTDADKKHPTIEAFEKKTGITVTYDEVIQDNLSYFAKVRKDLAAGADIGADTAVLTDWMVSRWIRFGYTQELDHSKIPNISHLTAKLRDVDYDPGRKHSLPWQGGFGGIAWNKAEFPDGFTGVNQMLSDPRLKGRVEVLSEMRDTVGLILLEHGTDIAKPFSDDTFANALEFLTGNISDGQIRRVTGNAYTDDLVSGKALAAIAWSGDIESINAEHGDQWEFAIPEAGGTLWNDNFLIPIGSRHKDNAEALMNFYYEPEIAAQVAAYVNYITPVDGAQDAMTAIDPTLAENPLIFPDADLLKRAHVFHDLTPAQDQAYSSAFQKVLLAA